VATFRRALWGWFGGVAILLLLLQALLLRWGLRPLRRAAGEVALIERGERARIGDDYPRELRPLTASGNELLASGGRRLERYREALADLGHSLKNPLAVLRSIGGDPATGERGKEIQDQVERMQQAIDWHVQRGAAAGRGGLGQTVVLGEMIERVGASLARAHAERPIRLECGIPPSVSVRGDPDDLMEIVGNLLDNACKYSSQLLPVRIEVVISSQPDETVLTITDNGPGIPATERNNIFERFYRIYRPEDGHSVKGHGLGLTFVRQVANAHGGSVTVDDAVGGGARFTVQVGRI
jgi:two-component system sensor histidine kinase PhoQ